VQLGLFSPDRLAVGEARQAMADLELDHAIEILEEVLAVAPDTADAEADLQIATQWRQTLEEVAGLEPGLRLERLWERISEPGAGPRRLPDGLRRALLGQMLQELQEHGIELVEPELCTGTLLLELGRAAEAEAALRKTLSRSGERPRLLVHLGTALWLLGRSMPARAAWVRALLLGPDQVRSTDIVDPRTARVIAEDDAGMAPITGWLARVLPLVEIERSRLAGSEPARIYACLLDAEEARRRHQHDDMVASRSRLRELSPATFDAYMARLG
jgi:tetratricopeptide (TPR) repeat protein